MRKKLNVYITFNNLFGEIASNWFRKPLVKFNKIVETAALNELHNQADGLIEIKKK